MASPRELLVDASNEVGFPAPASWQGLMEWADEALDRTLTRGSTQWAAASEHVFDALEAAMLGSQIGTRAALAMASQQAREGRPWCACPEGVHRVVVTDQRVCVRCAGRSRA